MQACCSSDQCGYGYVMFSLHRTMTPRLHFSVLIYLNKEVNIALLMSHHREHFSSEIVLYFSLQTKTWQMIALKILALPRGQLLWLDELKSISKPQCIPTLLCPIQQNRVLGTTQGRNQNT